MNVLNNNNNPNGMIGSPSKNLASTYPTGGNHQLSGGTFQDWKQYSSHPNYSQSPITNNNNNSAIPQPSYTYTSPNRSMNNNYNNNNNNVMIQQYNLPPSQYPSNNNVPPSSHAANAAATVAAAHVRRMMGSSPSTAAMVMGTHNISNYDPTSPSQLTGSQASYQKYPMNSPNQQQQIQQASSMQQIQQQSPPYMTPTKNYNPNKGGNNNPYSNNTTQSNFSPNTMKMNPGNTTSTFTNSNGGEDEETRLLREVAQLDNIMVRNNTGTNSIRGSNNNNIRSPSEPKGSNYANKIISPQSYNINNNTNPTILGSPSTKIASNNGTVNNSNTRNYYNKPNTNNDGGIIHVVNR